MTSRTRPRRATRRPFTVVVCTECGADDAATVLDAVRAAVRRCDHGVLVTTGCLLGADGCGGSAGHGGVTLALQPCSIERRPMGRVKWLGPIRCSDDVRALCNWIEHGDWEAPVPSRRWDAQHHVVSRD